MVYYKRAVLASCFALASSISAKEGIPSLKEIIREIPEDNVRGRIEAAYMDGNFDEVEKGLFSYLDEYNFDNSTVDDVQEVKEKAWSIISERVEEMRMAAYVDSPDEEEDAEPSPSEDGGMADINIDEALKKLEEMTLTELIEAVSDPELKNKIKAEMHSEDWTLAEEDLDKFVDSIPDVPAELSSRAKPIIHDKFNDFIDSKGGEPQLMEAEPSPSEDGGMADINIDEALKKLEEMTLTELIETVPDSELKNNIKAEMHSEDWTLAEEDLDKFVDSIPTIPAELASRAKPIIHDKFNDFIDGKGGEPQLMEGNSDIVDALHDLAATQQKIADLITKLEGGL